MENIAYLLVNFGGPRNLQEIEPFLTSLLTDKDVIRSPFPQVFHNILFGRIARKRSKTIALDYDKIGGGSPIWADTEYVASELRQRLKAPVATFHRYLSSTHDAFIDSINALQATEIRVFPMFPQFTYATTGSVARFFQTHFDHATLQKFKWVKSYPSHPAYIAANVACINDFLDRKGLREEEVFFLFSAHGVPQLFVDEGDFYEYECRTSFDMVMKAFPKAEGMLCFQSKFGPEEWIKPYTIDVCNSIESYACGRKQCVFVPITFTSDHIETLFEVEEQYMTVIAEKGFYPYRVPALNRRVDWIEAIVQILQDSTPCSTRMLVR